MNTPVEALDDSSPWSTTVLSVALRNVGEMEYGHPTGLVVDTGRVELMHPRGLSQTGERYIVLGGNDGVKPPTDALPGALTWAFDSELDQGHGSPSARLEPGETSGVRDLRMRMHAGVREFTIPLEIHTRIVAVRGVLGVSGGVLRHPAGATLELPPGVVDRPTSFRIEQVDTADPSALSPTFALEVGLSQSAFSASAYAAQNSAAAGLGDLTFSFWIGLEKQATSTAEFLVRTKLTADAYEDIVMYALGAELVDAGKAVRTRIDHLSSEVRRVTFAVQGIGDTDCSSEFEMFPVEPTATESAHPVVFIHGWEAPLFNCSTWRLWFEPRSKGQAVFRHLDRLPISSDLQYWQYTYPTFRSIDIAARDLADQLAQRFAGRNDVVLIGHSMGGLVARAAISRYGADAMVRRVITLGTPHLGSVLASPDYWMERALPPEVLAKVRIAPATPIFLGTDGARDLRPDLQGGFIEQLNRADGNALRSCIYTFAGDLENEDAIGSESNGVLRITYNVLAPSRSDAIVPVESALLPGSITQVDFGGGYDHLEIRTGNSLAGASVDPDRVLTRVAELVGEAYAIRELTVQVTPGEVRLVPGGQVQLTASARTPQGEEVDVDFTWSSANESVARVGADGVVTSVGVGTVLVDAIAPGGFRGSATIRVEPLGTTLWGFTPPKIIFDVAEDPRGTIYLLTGGHGASDLGGSLYAMDPNTGQVLWNQSGWRATRAGPVVGTDGTVYIAGSDGFGYRDFIRAYDGATGAVRWTAPGILNTVSGGYFSALLLTTDGIIVGPTTQDVRYYSAATGQLIRISGQTSWPGYSGPAAIANGKVYLTQGPRVVAFQTSNGTAVWQQTLPGTVLYDLMVAADGSVYAYANGGDLYALDGASGEIRWKAPQAGLYQSIITNEGDIITGGNFGKLVSLRPNGTRRWEVGTQFGPLFGTISAAGGTTILGANAAGTQRREIVALEESTGRVLWKIAPANASTYPLVLLRNGTLLVGWNSELRALRTPLTGPAVSPWPMRKHDSRRSGQLP